MAQLKGSQTERNLINAFAGESQARNRYSYFAQAAKSEGYEQIAAIFLETADNEKEHAKLFYIPLGNITGTVNAQYPFELGTTEANLESALNGEREEWEVLYAEGERIALDEGFDNIAKIFHNIIHAEKHHYQRFLKLLENVRNKTVFKKEIDADWKCRECGYILRDKEAPKECPNCHYPRAYFEVLCENY